MRYVLAIILLFVAQAQAAPTLSLRMAVCNEHLPFGIPAPVVKDSKQICRFGYATQHDNSRKVPLWVAYTLTPEHALGCYPRTSGFSPEPSVPVGKRAEDSDYTNSGFDRGHLASNNDMRWHLQVEDDVNVLSVTAPKNITLNRGAWKMLEDRARVYAVEQWTDILIYAGPIFSPDDKTIGLNKVVVPNAFYRVLVNLKTRQVVAFIYPNAGVSGPPDDFRVPYEEVVARIGFTLPLPEDPVMSQAMWPINAKTVTDARDCPAR